MSDERVIREKEAWNAGISRDGFEEIFSHSGAYWDDEVDRQLLKAFAPYADGRFLEIGSQTWHSWIHRLKTPVGALDCINISETELENGKLPSGSSHVDPSFHIMDAHKLDFDDGSFDVVFGKAILHHLDYAVALDEILRVLKPGGVMVFMEPLDFNPAMQLVRSLTPALRTPDEEPIRQRHWNLFQDRFDLDIVPIQLVSAVVSPVSQKVMRSSPQNIMTRTAFGIDRALSNVPGLRMWFRSALIVGKKPSVL